ncbi:hypothetical protein PC128_g26935 [Phytophthora cactorum]|nr:hypothetical protein PC128_g26935 [Phytophthora cactorum]
MPLGHSLDHATEEPAPSDPLFNAPASLLAPSGEGPCSPPARHYTDACDLPRAYSVAGSSRSQAPIAHRYPPPPGWAHQCSGRFRGPKATPGLEQPPAGPVGVVHLPRVAIGGISQGL